MLSPGGDIVVTLHKILGEIAKVVALLPPLLLMVALLIFFWGLAVFILKAGDEKSREGGRRIMVWGIVGLFVGVSVWGIVRILANTFGLDPTETCNPPQLNTPSSTTLQAC